MKTAGIVLAGGKSSRYGKPKMFEKYKDKYMYEYSVEALKQNSVCPIFISTNEKLIPFFNQSNVEFIIERETDEYQGPLYAMYHAFSKISDVDWFFVLACDIPFVTVDFVEKMIGKAEDGNFDAIIPVQSNRLQPLFGLYNRRIIGKMKESLEKNNRKLQLFLSEIEVLTVSYSKEDPIFMNINSPKDWPEEKQ